MLVKKLATAVVICGVTSMMLGCGGSKSTRTARNEYSDNASGIESVASFSGDILNPEQELALLNQRVVHFAYDDSRLTPTDERVLGVHSKYMLENPNLAITIKGHTDERGSREYNVALGERRAKSVERFMEAKGVPGNRISVVSYGKEQPISLESNEAAWAQNRRAELDYYDLG